MEMISEACRALAEPTRVRLVRALSKAPLNVTELVHVVGIAQSSVSHHLTRLKSIGLVREERQAGFVYHSLAVQPGDDLWPMIEWVGGSTDALGDDARLKELLSHREDHKNATERLLEPGQGWKVWAAALSTLLSDTEAVDFGCGTGAFTLELARGAKRVVGVDLNPNAIAQAKRRAIKLGIKNAQFLLSDFVATALPARKFDLALFSQSLHYVEKPENALKEAARVLKPKARWFVLELLPHRERWVEQRLGHKHLGFDSTVLETAAKRAGLKVERVETFSKEGESPFRVVLIAGSRP